MLGQKLRLLGVLIPALACGLTAAPAAWSGGGSRLAQVAQAAADQPLSEPADRAADYRAGLEAFESGDFDLAYVLWKPLAENGYAVAQYSLAKLFERGGGAILKNPVEAALWYRQAAAQGVVAAQNNLAIMYAKGEGVPQLPAHAVSLWRKAAEGGHPMAQYNLALSYFNGNGIEVDRAAAATWFLGAGRAGVSDAQYALGQIYRQGLGVERDDEQALYWYQQAAGQGHQAAKAEATSLSDSGVSARLPSGEGGVLLALRGGEGKEAPAPDALSADQSFQEIPSDTVVEPPANPEKDAEEQLFTDESLGNSERMEASPAGQPEPEEVDATANEEAPESPAQSTEQQALAPSAGVPPQADAATPLPRRKPSSTRFQPPKELPRWALRIPPPPPKRNPLLAGLPPAEGQGGQAGVGPAEEAAGAPLLAAISYPPGSYSVWLLSTSKQGEAELYWRNTESSHPEVFAGLTPSVSAVTVDDLGSYYRLAAGPLPDQEAAKALCRRLRVHRPDAFCKVEAH